MKIAIAMTAFDRPDYLEQVLASYQQADLCGADCYYFVDGPVPGDGPMKSRVDECEKLCRSTGGTVVRQEYNRGTASQVYESKRLLFREREYDVVISCVDDVIVAPYAISALLALRERLQSERGLWLADVYNTLIATPEEKRRRLGEISIIGYMALYSMDRHIWELIEPVLAEYIERFIQPLIDGGIPRPYRHRGQTVALEGREYGNDQIRAWMTDYLGRPVSSGFPTSQDGCVGLVMNKHAIRPWSTAVNHCKNIGVHGEHCDAAKFSQLNMDQVNLDLYDADTVIKSIKSGEAGVAAPDMVAETTL